jgi:hypothetical protein
MPENGKQSGFGFPTTDNQQLRVVSCNSGAFAYLREERSCPARPREAGGFELRRIVSTFGLVDDAMRGQTEWRLPFAHPL